MNTIDRVYQIPVERDSIPYAQGDVLGGLLQINPGKTRDMSGNLRSITLAVPDFSTNVAVDFVLFNAEPINTTIVDNEPLDIDPADIHKVAWQTRMTTNIEFISSKISLYTDINMRIQFSGNIYFCLVRNGALVAAPAVTLTLSMAISIHP
jgi:hypothetical protein